MFLAASVGFVLGKSRQGLSGFGSLTVAAGRAQERQELLAGTIKGTITSINCSYADTQSIKFIHPQFLG